MKNIKKALLFYLLISISCNSDNNSEPINLPPSDFEITVLSNAYLESEIEWSESFDPEDKAINYSVYLDNNQLINNLSVRNYKFKNLEPLSEYSGKVVAYDSNGNETIKFFSFTTTGNLPPSDFSISSIVPSNISINIFWEESIDPENENVSYDLYVDEKLIESNIQQTYYLIENLNISTNYQIKIIAKDQSSNTTELLFEEQTLNGIYEGNLDFTFQEKIDDFGKLGYVEINGDLEISGFQGNSDIKDLIGLRSIKRITGRFDIRALDELTSLSDLNIEFIGATFSIKSNENLQYVNGLENLTQVLGSLEIEQNRHLSNINAFNKLITIGGYLSITSNGLNELNGFINLNQVDGINIGYNSLLSTIKGFNKIETLESNFSIHNNTSLSSINGFYILRRTSGFYIEDTLTHDLNIFSSLETVGEMSIDNNDNLVNLEGLSSLINIHSLYIFRNNNLISVDGLENIGEIEFTFQIGLNSNLSDFCALQNYVNNYSSTSYISIYNNKYNPTKEEIVNGNCKL